jgi:tetratricopeptide (TPR) repeat protein
MSQGDLLARINQATNADDINWVITSTLIESLGSELKELIYAAAIPHMFEIPTLFEVTGIEDSVELTSTLIKLPFVETFNDWAFNIHEQTRDLIIRKYWSENLSSYRQLAQKIADAFYKKIHAAMEQLDQFHKQDESKRKSNAWVEEFASQYITQFNHSNLFYHAEAHCVNLAADEEGGLDEIVYAADRWLSAYGEFHAQVMYMVASMHELYIYGLVTKNIFHWAMYLEARLLEEEYDTSNALQKANQILAESTNEELLAATHFIVGEIMLAQDREQEAFVEFTSAQGYFKSVGNKQGEANSLMGQGHTFLHETGYTKAKVKYEKALEIYLETESHIGQGNAYGHLGIIYSQQEKYEEAKEEFLAAQKSYEAVSDRKGQAGIIYELGILEFDRGKYNEARSFISRALSIYRNIGEKLGEANCLKHNALISVKLKNKNQALSNFLKAINLYSVMGMSFREADCWSEMGDLSIAFHDYYKSVDYRKNAADRYKDARRLDQAAIEYAKQAESYLLAIELKQAFESNEIAIAIFENLKDKVSLANCIRIKAEIARVLANYELAASLYARAIDLYASEQNDKGTLQVNLELAQLLILQEKIDEGMSLLERITNNTNEETLGLRSRVIAELAWANFITGENQKAIKLLTEAISASDGEPDFYLRRARVYLEDRNYGEALKDLEKASVQDRYSPYLFDLEGDYYFLRGKYKKALTLYEKASAKVPMDWNYQFEIGLTLFVIGRNKNGLDAYKKGLNLIYTKENMTIHQEVISSLNENILSSEKKSEILTLFENCMPSRPIPSFDG